MISKIYNPTNILKVDVSSLAGSLYFIEFETNTSRVRMKFIRMQ